MSKELTITGKISLPDDEFDAATIMHNAKGAIVESERLLSEALGEGFKFATETKNQRKPRTTAGANGPVGRPRKAQPDASATAAA